MSAVFWGSMCLIVGFTVGWVASFETFRMLGRREEE